MPETATLEPEVPVEAPNPAAILAKSGKQSSVDNPIDISASIKEPAAPEKKSESKVDATPITPAPEVKPATTPENPITPVQASPATLEEVLKKYPEHEVLKALGLDEKMGGFLSTWKGGGDVNRYIREATTDYSKMTGEQLMRHQLKQDNPEMSDEDFEELYQAKVIDAYKLDPTMYEEKDVKRGRIILNADTKKIREGLMTAQKQFILDSKPPEAKADPAVAEAQASQIARIENYQKEVKGGDLYKAVTTDKVIPLEIEGQKFKYPVPDPAKIESALFDNKEWQKMMLTADGKQDIEKHFLLSAIATDHKGFLSSLAKFYIGIGKSQAVEPIENIKPPEDGKTALPDPILTGAAALAKHGAVSG